MTARAGMLEQQAEKEAETRFKLEQELEGWRSSSNGSMSSSDAKLEREVFDYFKIMNV